MRRVLHLVPVDEVGRNRRRVRARAIMCLASAAMLLVLELAWAVAARAQANIVLSGAGVTGSIATNTNWSVAKNGGIASGTVSWTVGLTKVSVSHEIIQVDGLFRMTNTGTGPAALGNIILNLQRPCGKVWVSAAADAADSTFGDAATFGNFVEEASFENVARNNPLSSCAGPGNYVVTSLPGQTLHEGSHANSNSNTDSGLDSNTGHRPDSDCHPDPGCDSNSNSHTYPGRHANSICHADAGRDADSSCHADPCRHADARCNTNSNSHTDSGSDADSGRHADADCDSNTGGHADSDRDSYARGTPLRQG
jgi:hypothetical protein